MHGYRRSNASVGINHTLRSLLECGVDLLSESLLLCLDNQVHDGHGGCGDTQSNAVELALHLGAHKGNSLGSTGGGGDDVERSSTRATQVAVGSVKQALVASVRMGSGHCALDNAELVLHTLYTV